MCAQMAHTYLCQLLIAASCAHSRTPGRVGHDLLLLTSLLHVLAGVDPKYCSFGAWRWAVCTILSRTMYVPWDTVGVYSYAASDCMHVLPARMPAHTDTHTHTRARARARARRIVCFSQHANILAW